MQAGQQPPFDGTLFLACSGAVTANIRTSNPEGSGLPGIFVQKGEGKTQLEQYADRLAADDFTPSSWCSASEATTPGSRPSA